MSTANTNTHMNFAYWVPNVSGGLVTSTVEQRTDWGIDYNRTLAQAAEDAGFEYALTQVRYLGSYSAEYQHESVSFSLALLEATKKLNVIAAVHPGLWLPGVLANLGSTASEIYGGRLVFNIVSGSNSGHSVNRGWTTTNATADPQNSSRYSASSGLRRPRTLPETFIASGITPSNLSRRRCPSSFKAAPPPPPGNMEASTPTGTSRTAAASMNCRNRSPMCASTPRLREGR